jgi:hypothetical protein
MSSALPHRRRQLLSVFEEAKSGAEAIEQVETFDHCGTDEKQGWVLLDRVEDAFELFESFTDANIIGRGGEEFFEGGRKCIARRRGQR